MINFNSKIFEKYIVGSTDSANFLFTLFQQSFFKSKLLTNLKIEKNFKLSKTTVPLFSKRISSTKQIKRPKLLSEQKSFPKKYRKPPKPD